MRRQRASQGKASPRTDRVDAETPIGQGAQIQETKQLSDAAGRIVSPQTVQTHGQPHMLFPGKHRVDAPTARHVADTAPGQGGM